MRRGARLALATGAAVAGAAAVRPVLDAAVARVEARMNPVGKTVASDASERAHALHASLRVADLHADSLLWGRDLLERGTRGAVDVPRLIEGNVALQVLAMAVKTPRGLNIERNENLRHNPRVSLHLNDDGRGNDIVLVEGEARVDDATPRPEDNAPYNAKYGDWIREMFSTAEEFTSVYNVPLRIRPTRARAFGA